jgi:hypothetical protein
MWQWIDRMPTVLYEFSRISNQWTWNDCYGWGRPSKSLLVAMFNAITNRRD